MATYCEINTSYSPMLQSLDLELPHPAGNQEARHPTDKVHAGGPPGAQSRGGREKSRYGRTNEQYTAEKYSERLQ